MVSSFWLDNPSILFNKKKIMEVWPQSKYSMAAKLNAITRLVIILTLLGYLFTRNMKILVTGLITVVVIVILYKSQKQKRKLNRKMLKEGFTSPELYEKVKSSFMKPTKKNPLMNVLLPEIQYNPTRKPAAPAFNPVVEKQINQKVADPRLFLDLGDNIAFDQSMRNFYATANTTIPNDQTAFAEYCYGTMPSCRGGDYLQCSKNNYRNPT
jgi:hypothetical protein